MGQKIHPYGFRVGTLYGWQSSWYADKNYAEQLHEDIAVREFIKKKLYHAGISKVVLERTGEKLVINIHTARPGILIGKRGAEVDVLRQDLKKFTSADVFINVKEIRKAELDAQLVAENIATQLERRVALINLNLSFCELCFRWKAIGSCHLLRRLFQPGNWDAVLTGR